MPGSRRLVAIVELSVAFALAASFSWAQDAVLTEEEIISGTMEIDFKTRTDLDMDGAFLPGSPKLGVQDVYKFALTAGKRTQYSGVIKRRPDLFRADGVQKVQQGAMTFEVHLRIRHPNLSETKNVGKWVGIAPIDSKTGAYDLSGGGASPLRISIDADLGRQPPFRDIFAGDLFGMSKKAEKLSAHTYTRRGVDRIVAINVKEVDSIRFQNLELARGPLPSHPHATVEGRLDYDVRTGDWLTDGVKFTYQVDERVVEDVMTGSVRWVEDQNRLATGKGFYDFNLRFNEANHRPAAAIDRLSDEEAWFVVDAAIPCLTGRMSFVDEFVPGTSLPAKSKITFALNANQLTKSQVLNFFHLWLLATAAIHDE